MQRKYAPNQIKRLRIERGLTLEALGGAMASGVTASTVAKLENGHMALSLDYINELAQALRVSPAEIIKGEGDDVSLRMVPRITEIPAGNWREAVNLSTSSIAVPAHLGGENLFALRLKPDNAECGSDKFIVIDPDDGELRDGKIYAIVDGDLEIAIKQFCADPLSLQPCGLALSNDGIGQEPILVGAVPFTVIGRAVYMFAGQDL